MFQSLRYSNLILRLSLAIVFFWFGVDKFFHPDYWVNAWVPRSFVLFFEHLKLRSVDIVYLAGIFEVLVGTSLLTNIFVVVFSSLAVLFIANVMILSGLNEVLVRDIGLIGALLSLVFWPSSRNSTSFR